MKSRFSDRYYGLKFHSRKDGAVISHNDFIQYGVHHTPVHVYLLCRRTEHLHTVETGSKLTPPHYSIHLRCALQLSFSITPNVLSRRVKWFHYICCNPIAALYTKFTQYKIVQVESRSSTYISLSFNTKIRTN